MECIVFTLRIQGYFREFIYMRTVVDWMVPLLPRKTVSRPNSWKLGLGSYLEKGSLLR